MKYKIINDPLNVLSTTKPYVEKPEYVTINEDKLQDLIDKTKERIDTGLPERDEEFFSLGNTKEDVQVVFLENVVNFCFWAEKKGQEKWKAEFNGEEDDGASALRIVFERAIANKVPILNAEYLSNLSFSDVQQTFKPSNNIEIPLLKKRHENLVEAGKVLKEKYDGWYINLMKEAKFDAVEITKKTFSDFSSYDDSYNKVNFYKRAQLNTFDIGLIEGIEIHNINQLTAMADYKLPQILRAIGIIEYSKDLEKQIDSYELIEKGSRKEIEIRSATIWAIELVAQSLNITAGLADRAIWWLSREEKIEKPYHRTYTIYY